MEPKCAATLSMGENKLEEWERAKEGIDLLLNNETEEAEKLFKSNSESIQMLAGYSFVTFMNALMSYEEEKLTLALNCLKETERRCANDMGWLKSFKNKMFGSDKQQKLAESLEEQIILADTQVCEAILVFLQQEFSGYFKGGWVLRKAWKLYQNIYNQVLELYIKTFGDSEELGPYLPHPRKFRSTSPTSNSLNTPSPTTGMCSPTSSSDWSIPPTPESELPPDTLRALEEMERPESRLSNGYSYSVCDSTYSDSRKPTRSFSANSLRLSSLTQSLSYPLGFLNEVLHPSKSKTLDGIEFQNSLPEQDIDPETIHRLMGAASFGYGVFQLSVSLLPPSILRFTQLLGFGTDRRAGIACLMYARNGADMRAPLATLALLWYHTIVRPFFALDGNNVHAGVEAAQQLIDESTEKYGKSALFLFFDGRINRLRSNIPKALDSYQMAVDNSTQREIKLLCLHEVGWCHLICLDFNKSMSTFMLLKQRSRWSRSFYAYLGLICSGACEQADMNMIKELREIINASTQKGTQLEVFISRRITFFPEATDKLYEYGTKYWKYYTYELLYLWNALGSCSKDVINAIILDCLDSSSEPMPGVAKLVAGSCYSIMGDVISAVDSYRQCLESRTNIPHSNDTHISAFAQYELAMLLIKNSETQQEGKLLLQKVQSQYSNYDFEHRLNVLIHSVLKSYS